DHPTALVAPELAARVGARERRHVAVRALEVAAPGEVPGHGVRGVHHVPFQFTSPYFVAHRRGPRRPPPSLPQGTDGAGKAGARTRVLRQGLGRRRSLILNMPHGMLTVGETTRETAYAPVASSLGPRLARNLERHQRPKPASAGARWNGTNGPCIRRPTASPTRTRAGRHGCR